MGDEYTPTTEEVRNNMAFGASFAAMAIRDDHSDWIDALKDVNWPTPGIREGVKSQFDAWLAAHDAQRDQEAEARGAERAAGRIEARVDDMGDPHPAWRSGMLSAARIARAGVDGCRCNVGAQKCPAHPDNLRTQEEKIAFRKAWDETYREGSESDG